MSADLQSIRNAAIDEAIAICEAEENHVRSLGLHMAVAACGTIADKLRGLKYSEPKPTSDQGNANADLVRASRLVMSSFAYAPGAGPAWYEAAREALAKVGAA